MMVGHLNPLNPAFNYKVSVMTAALSKYFPVSVAQVKANYLMYAQLLQQANLWAFMDAFRIVGLVCFLIIPILFFMKPNEAKSSENADMSAMH